jgi:hypothetical protein
LQFAQSRPERPEVLGRMADWYVPELVIRLHTLN